MSEAEPSRDAEQILTESFSQRTESPEELFSLLYQELRLVARAYMRRERADHTLQATALVNEAYMRLFDGEEFRWENRKHLFCTVTRSMRRILVDQARTHRAERHGGAVRKVSLDEQGPAICQDLPQLIALSDALERLDRVAETTVFAEAGVACARIARECIHWGLGPAEFLAGIPGTLGGALAMNAGAFGGEIWDHVLEVQSIDRRGVEHVRARAEFEVGYRSVRAPVPEEGFLAARLHFDRKLAANEAEVRELLAKRKATQPIGAWSCGSVFANPPGDHAARLIEAAGLKGFRIGDAGVSQKHANFIINYGAASAADLERLIEHVRDTVERVHGVRLTPEVRILGEPA